MKTKTKEELFNELEETINKATTPLKGDVSSLGAFSYSSFLFSSANSHLQSWLNDFIYRNNPWVYSCNQMIANSAKSIGYSFIPKKVRGKSPAKSTLNFLYNLEAFFNNCNEEQEFGEIYKQLHLDLGNEGKAYLIWEFLEKHPPFRTPVALYRADYRTMRPIHYHTFLEYHNVPKKIIMKYKNPIIGWAQEIISSDDIKHFLEPIGMPYSSVRPLNKYQPWCLGEGHNVRYFYPEQISEIRLDAEGTSPLQTLRKSLATEFAAQDYTLAYFKHSTKTGMILSLEEGTAKDAELNQKWIEEKYSNPENAWKVMFLLGGVKLVRASANTSDVQYLEIREANKEEVCSALGVDPLLLSGKGGKASEREEAKRTFEETTVTPRSATIFGKITNKIEKIFPRYRGKFQIIPGVKGRSSLHLLNIAQKMAMSGASTNEVRGLYGMPEREEEIYDKPLIAANILPLEVSVELGQKNSNDGASSSQKDNNPGGQPRDENVQGGRSGRYNEQR